MLHAGLAGSRLVTGRRSSSTRKAEARLELQLGQQDGLSRTALPRWRSNPD
jgi:hypothetical protein